ncbi:MAG: thermonuclease family protein [Theionarchaea archaeon]|nr:thermonuclease family protein [Theionarchaea archaeon]
MKEICVHLGHSSKNPDKHCFDGDSSYVTGSFENALVRLLGVDAPEVRGLNLYYLRKSGFLSRLDGNLRKYLEPKLTNESIGIHKNLGFEARDFLESILEEDLVISFEREVFDRYERPLVYLAVKDQDTYNLRLVQAGYAIPYFIYPNAVSPTEEGEFTYNTIEKFQGATVKAKRNNLGIWKYIDRTLLPMELRFLTRRELPVKYCADLERNLLYSPQYYLKVSIENRLFFYPKDVSTALQKKFKPMPDCDGWLHKVWNVLKEEEKREK